MTQIISVIPLGNQQPLPPIETPYHPVICETIIPYDEQPASFRACFRTLVELIFCGLVLGIIFLLLLDYGSFVREKNEDRLVLITLFIFIPLNLLIPTCTLILPYGKNIFELPTTVILKRACVVISLIYVFILILYRTGRILSPIRGAVVTTAVLLITGLNTFTVVSHYNIRNIRKETLHVWTPIVVSSIFGTLTNIFFLGIYIRLSDTIRIGFCSIISPIVCSIFLTFARYMVNATVSPDPHYKWALLLPSYALINVIRRYLVSTIGDEIWQIILSLWLSLLEFSHRVVWLYVKQKLKQRHIRPVPVIASSSLTTHRSHDPSDILHIDLDLLMCMMEYGCIVGSNVESAIVLARIREQSFAEAFYDKLDVLGIQLLIEVLCDILILWIQERKFNFRICQTWAAKKVPYVVFLWISGTGAMIHVNYTLIAFILKDAES